MQLSCSWEGAWKSSNVSLHSKSLQTWGERQEPQSLICLCSVSSILLHADKLILHPASSPQWEQWLNLIHTTITEGLSPSITIMRILHTPCPLFFADSVFWKYLIKSIFSRPILPYQLQSLPSLWLDSQCPHFILLHDSHPHDSTAYWKTFFQEILARSSAIFLETVHKEVRITHCCALTLSCQMTNWCAVWLCSPFSDTQTHTPLPLVIHLPGNLHSLAEKMSKLRRNSV